MFKILMKFLGLVALYVAGYIIGYIQYHEVPMAWAAFLLGVSFLCVVTFVSFGALAIQDIKDLKFRKPL